MFFLRSDGLALREQWILGLRLSLNTPVVSTETLAVGPARGALLVHAEPDGRPNVTIGIRSLRSGQVVLYSFEGDLREHSSLAVGVDGALSFAESMGFLFDEDELEAGSGAEARSRALGLWGDLMGHGVGVPEEDEIPELLLDEVAASSPFVLETPAEDATEVDVLPALDPSDGYVPQFDGDLGGEGGFQFEGGIDADALGATEPGLPPLEFELAASSPPAAAPRVAAGADAVPILDLAAEAVEMGRRSEPAPPSLSKFRGGADPVAPARGRRAKLARLKLVRRESDGGRPHPILRLFGSF